MKKKSKRKNQKQRKKNEFMSNALAIMLSLPGSALCLMIVYYISGHPKSALGMILLQMVYAFVLYKKFKQTKVSDLKSEDMGTSWIR
jgi:hypothetical protein